MKVSIWIQALAVGALACGGSAQADCAFPKAPASIPDGKTASEQEMITAMNAFKAYNDEVTAFGSCLDEETNGSGMASAQRMQMKTLKTKKLNAAVDELQAKAKLFNEQVRIYKARS